VETPKEEINLLKFKDFTGSAAEIGWCGQSFFLTLKETFDVIK